MERRDIERTWASLSPELERDYVSLSEIVRAMGKRFPVQGAHLRDAVLALILYALESGEALAGQFEPHQPHFVVWTGAADQVVERIAFEWAKLTNGPSRQTSLEQRNLDSDFLIPGEVAWLIGPRPMARELLVQSEEHSAELASFDPLSGALFSFDPGGPPAHWSRERPLRGHFARLGSQLAILYRAEGTLWLRMGAEVFPLGPASGRSARWSIDGTRATFELVEGEQVLHSVTYDSQIPDDPSPELDPTPFAEAEHWDFGLFVRNVISDEDRARRIYLTE